jgi:hypothetical protein
MKDNHCQMLQDLLLTQEDPTTPLPEELQRHLAQCQECQKTAKLLGLLQHASEDAKLVPQPSLDRKTLALCHRELKTQNTLRTRIFRTRTIWAAAALLVAMGVITAFSLTNNQNTAPTTAPQAKIALADDAEWGESLLDTGMDLVNDEISSMELNFNLLAADLYY